MQDNVKKYACVQENIAFLIKNQGLLCYVMTLRVGILFTYIINVRKTIAITELNYSLMLRLNRQ